MGDGSGPSTCMCGLGALPEGPWDAGLRGARDPDPIGGGAEAPPPAAAHDDGESHSKALGALSAAGEDADARAALARVGTDPSECAEALPGRSPGEACSSPATVALMRAFIVDREPLRAARRKARPEDGGTPPDGGRRTLPADKETAVFGSDPAAPARKKGRAARVGAEKKGRAARVGAEKKGRAARVGAEKKEDAARVGAEKKEDAEARPRGRAARVGAEKKEDAEALPRGPETGAVVRTAARLLGCGSESCVVAHPALGDYARRAAARPFDPGLELALRFKPRGPRHSTQLLSNYDIEGVLQGWAAAHPSFYNYSFNMVDFDATGGSLARVDVAGVLEGREVQNLGARGGVVRRPCRTFACVLNTDLSSGRGKHWVALFGDCRGRGAWTVEFFNSAGNPPPAAVTRWMEMAAARLAALRAERSRRYGSAPVKTEVAADVRHQDSRTECGLYVLYFIRRRLEGAPLEEFRGGRLPDSAMVAFRRHLFRAS